MMGKPNDPEEMGLIPRLCHDLFMKIEETSNKNLKYSVEVLFFYLMLKYLKNQTFLKIDLITVNNNYNICIKTIKYFGANLKITLMQIIL